MTGNNHYADCTCGWCIGGWHNAASIRTIEQPNAPPFWPGLDATLKTYTDPNAFCPVCGASVFFYASPFGGRVFFDELGPPWPKHPCTDNGRLSAFREYSVRTVGNAAKTPIWKRNGWMPVTIERVNRFPDSDWSWVTARRLDTRASFTRSALWREELVPGTPAHVKALDTYGIGYISWMFFKESGPERVEDLLVHRTFGVIPIQIFRKALNGNADMAALVGHLSAFAWRVKRDDDSVAFQDFVSWPISRAWLQRAADNGSEKAKDFLIDPIWHIVKWKT